MYDVDEFDDIYANYQDAKAKMNALRTSRGFYPVVAMLPQNMSGNASGGQARNGGGKSKSSKGKKSSPKDGKSVNPKGGRQQLWAGAGRQLRLRCHPVATRRER